MQKFWNEKRYYSFDYYLKNTFGEKIIVEKKTYNAYLQLKEFLKEKNIKIGIEKGHLKEDNKNSSEHVTGLALDFSI